MEQAILRPVVALLENMPGETSPAWTWTFPERRTWTVLRKQVTYIVGRRTLSRITRPVQADTFCPHVFGRASQDLAEGMKLQSEPSLFE